MIGGSGGRSWATIVLLSVLTACSTREADELASVRQEIELTANWRFFFGDAPGEVISSNFDDRGWESVTVPHTWNRLGEAGATRTAATNNRRGVGWYRLQFAAPAVRANQRCFLQFDAAGSLADVWLNGEKLGSHAGAFSSFRFDVTDVMQPGKSNLLVVKSDNTKPAPGASTQDIIPLDGDFFVHGGLYRKVSLITTSDLHLELLDHAGPGVYVHTTNVENGRADLAVLAKLRNDSSSSREISVVTRVLDA